MGKLTVIKFGNGSGKGAVIRYEGWFSTKTYTLVESELGDTFNKWVCLETGRYFYQSIGTGQRLSLFYRGQYETRR